MSDIDPNSDRVEVTRATYAPGGATEVRRISRSPNNTVLWGIALVGAVTIAAGRELVFTALRRKDQRHRQKRTGRKRQLKPGKRRPIDRRYSPGGRQKIGGDPHSYGRGGGDREPGPGDTGGDPAQDRLQRRGFFSVRGVQMHGPVGDVVGLAAIRGPGRGGGRVAQRRRDQRLQANDGPPARPI